MKPFKFLFFIALMFFVLTSCFETNEDVLPESEYYNATWRIDTNPNMDKLNTHDSIFLRSHMDYTNFDNPLVHPYRRGSLYAIIHSGTPENVEDPCYYYREMYDEKFMLLSMTKNKDNKIVRKLDLGYFGYHIDNARKAYKSQDPMNLEGRTTIWKSYPTGPTSGLLICSWSDREGNQIYASDTVKYTVTGMHKNFSMSTNNNFKLNLKYTTKFVYEVGNINYPEGKTVYIPHNTDVFPANNCKE